MAGRPDDISNPDSLNWLAVQYVLGELTESDATAFEERLASDSAACEAVAAAAQLTLTLQTTLADDSTEPAPHAATPGVRPLATMPASKTTPRGSWLALAGATTVSAAALLAAMSLGPNGPRQEPLARADRSASELVSLWRTGSTAMNADTDESEVEIDESNHEMAVPDWLFAAVSLEQGKPAGNANDDVQEN